MFAFEPRVPLTAAERHVDFPKINEHIAQRRAAVEHHALAAAKRVGFAATQFSGIDTPLAALVDKLDASLKVTADFGYTHARQEIRSLRRGVLPERGNESRGSPPLQRPRSGNTSEPITAATNYAGISAQGLDRVKRHLASRAHQAAIAIALAARNAADKQQDPFAKPVEAAAAAARALHNQALALVGEALNMGRTAGALSFPSPPEFALRSEQLDQNTCEACDQLHGTIVAVDSPEYYAILPPADCYGGGRCRGVMVFADGPADVRQPQDLAA